VVVSWHAKKQEAYLPENEMLLDDSLNGFIRPHITIQNLTGELHYILNIDHKPLLTSYPSISSLKAVIGSLASCNVNVAQSRNNESTTVHHIYSSRVKLANKILINFDIRSLLKMLLWARIA
jgi:hypothetical protein